MIKNIWHIHNYTRQFIPPLPFHYSRDNEVELDSITFLNIQEYLTVQTVSLKQLALNKRFNTKPQNKGWQTPSCKGALPALDMWSPFPMNVFSQVWVQLTAYVNATPTANTWEEPLATVLSAASVSMALETWKKTSPEGILS